MGTRRGSLGVNAPLSSNCAARECCTPSVACMSTVPCNYFSAVVRNPAMAQHPLKIWRKAKGLSVAELARQVGVTREAVRQWEDEDVIPAHLHMRKLAKVTGGAVRADHFYGISQS